MKPPRRPGPTRPPASGRPADRRPSRHAAPSGPSAGPSPGHGQGARRPFADDRRGPPRPGPRHPDRYLYGLHAATEAILNPERRVTRIQGTETALAAIAGALARAREAGIDRPEPETVERALLDRFLKGAVHQGLAVEVAPLEAPELDDLGRAATLATRTVVVVLDQVTDPHNVGAILRSAAAFGAAGLVVTDRHAPEVTGVLAKAACGAVEHVPIIRVRNLGRALDSLAEWGFLRVGLAEEAEATLAEALASEPAGPARMALVLGAEGEGLRPSTRQRCDRLARLPTSGPIASLNVSNAAAIALYEACRATPVTAAGP